LSVITFLLPNIQLTPNQVERITSAIERIADSLERKYPPTLVPVGHSRPSSIEDFSVYTDKDAERDYLEREGLLPDDTTHESPSFALAHVEEFGGGGDEDGDKGGIDPNGGLR
jgi:hypothetical protein